MMIAPNAIQTAIGTSKTRPNERKRNVWSEMRAVNPPSTAVATPIPAKPTPSVVMKEGVFSLTCRNPFRKPRIPPTRMARGTAQRPIEIGEISFTTSKLTITAVTATTPSMERSILPIRITNVVPMHNTSGMAAEFNSLSRLPIVRKLPLNRLITRHNTTRTANGAQSRQRPITDALCAGCARTCVPPQILSSHAKSGRQEEQPDDCSPGCKHSIEQLSRDTGFGRWPYPRDR